MQPVEAIAGPVSFLLSWEVILRIRDPIPCSEIGFEVRIPPGSDHDTTPGKECRKSLEAEGFVEF